MTYHEFFHLPCRHCLCTYWGSVCTAFDSGESTHTATIKKSLGIGIGAFSHNLRESMRFRHVWRIVRDKLSAAIALLTLYS